MQDKSLSNSLVRLPLDTAVLWIDITHTHRNLWDLSAGSYWAAQVLMSTFKTLDAGIFPLFLEKGYVTVNPF